jgi:hypothetical protein
MEEYKKHFDITQHTVFAYDGDIYTNSVLPYFLIVHEEKHLEQQNKYCLDVWVNRYINDIDFRLQMEVEAYQAQLNSVKDKQKRDRMRFICAKEISSSLYGNIISLEDALKILK